jgi:hypothetical protein
MISLADFYEKYYRITLPDGSKIAPVLTDAERAFMHKVEGKPVKFTIGVDAYDLKAPTYCLIKEQDGRIQNVLGKIMKDPAEFNEEVSNLAKYFDAKICSIEPFPIPITQNAAQ